MFFLVMAIHILLCFALIGLVLLQQGKGADLGPALGGGSNTLFGAAGATAFVVKATTVAAVLFMCTSIFLVKHYRSAVSAEGAIANRLEGSLLQEAAKRAEQPAVEASQASAGSTAEGVATPEQTTEVPTSQSVAVPAQVPAPVATVSSEGGRKEGKD